MKKTLFILTALLLTLVLTGSVCAEGLPSVNEVLGDPDLKNQIVEVSDSLDGFSPLNDELTDYGDFRVLVLQRVLPEKEFTALEYSGSETIEYENGFPDDFTGVDIGEEKVYYRGDVMSRIPEFFRAESFESADLVIVAENYYEWSGTVMVTDYEESDDEEMPDFENPDDLLLYLLLHQKKIKSITYYPKFDVYSLIDFYNPITKAVVIGEIREADAKRFARNPQACDLWDDMQALPPVTEALTAETVDPAAVQQLIGYSDWAPEETRNVWLSYVNSGDYAGAAALVREYYWQQAAALKELDPSEENREKYDLILQNRNDTALALFVNYCDYSGFDQSVESIRLSKEYMGEEDPQWYEDMMETIVQLLNGEGE